MLERRARDRGRLFEILALDDGELIDALGGRRKEELHEAHGSFRPDERPGDGDEETTCRHRGGYPRELRTRGSPWLLHVVGGCGRLRALTDAPTVAVLGGRRVSDYGSEMALGLARGLVACGVTVASAGHGDVAAAAQAGAIAAGGGVVALTGDGLEVCRRSRKRAHYRELARTGCVASELPREVGGRTWAPAACERTAVRLARLVVVVEAEDTPADLAAAVLAKSLGRVVAAVPGRATSPFSTGSHVLLKRGAALVCEAGDVLELLDLPTGGSVSMAAELPPRLRAVLEEVGCGRDTADALVRSTGEPFATTLLALTELELMGLLRRVAGGRYLRCPEAPRAASRTQPQP